MVGVTSAGLWGVEVIDDGVDEKAVVLLVAVGVLEDVVLLLFAGLEDVYGELEPWFR